MPFTKRLIVPLCDIMLHIKDGLPKDNSQPVVDMGRTRQKKRRREKLEERLKEESESEEEKHNSSKENQEESESTEEEHNSFEENEENEMSEFEKRVQKNREERMAFLQALKINEVKEDFAKLVESIAPKPKPRILRPKVVQPIRRSRRLAKLDIDLSEKAICERIIAKYTIEAKPLPSKYPFEEAISVKNDEEAISVKNDFSEFVANFDFSIDNNVKFNSNYESNFKNMKIGETSVAKLVPTRITSLAVHPAADKIMIIAGSKYGHLGFWNVTSHSRPIVFLPHTALITNLKVDPYNSLKIMSSSYDGTLRSADMENKSFNKIFDVSDETTCTYFDYVTATTLLVSHGNGNVSVIDVRNKSLRGQKTHKCHTFRAKTVHVHPMNTNLFLTADRMGTLKLWDLRKLQKKPIIDVCHHKQSVTSAFFSPATGKHILSTSLDNSLCVFDSANLEKEILTKSSIKHNNFTGRWLSPFKATWLPNSDELFSVGSMNYPRRIEIYNSNGSNVFNFMNDEYLTTITAVNEFHPSLNVLAGANSSGKVYIFADTQLGF